MTRPISYLFVLILFLLFAIDRLYAQEAGVTSVDNVAAAATNKDVKSSSNVTIYKDDSLGFTGLVNKKNVYIFDLDDSAEKATLKIWASGDIGLDTYGSVKVMPPKTGDAKIVYHWKPADFEKTTKEIKTYKDLKPITCDVSKVVRGHGKHRVLFSWAKGKVGLVILRVELEVEHPRRPDVNVPDLIAELAHEESVTRRRALVTAKALHPVELKKLIAELSLSKDPELKHAAEILKDWQSVRE